MPHINFFGFSGHPAVMGPVASFRAIGSKLEFQEVKGGFYVRRQLFYLLFSFAGYINVPFISGHLFPACH
jgi:hypothetical protein